MKVLYRISLCIFIAFLVYRVYSQERGERAMIPPRGWNSYDCFSWTISEEEYLQSVEIISDRLSSYGYKYAVVDYLWYRRKVPGAHHDSLGFDVIDEWGRMVPDPDRWPSSKDGKGFSEIANRVHSLGLKFGIHVMKGISTQAVKANTPILDISTGAAYEESGRKWTAQDIGIKERACPWMPNGFMSVNTTLGAGKAFLKSLYVQYAAWGIDFVKLDCVFGDDLDLDEITYVSEVLKERDLPIVFSLSPGVGATPDMAKNVNGLVNMYRVTGDDWDTWADVVSHFDVARDFSIANMLGATGLRGRSWPDLDMLPLGWLTDPASDEGPHRNCSLTLDEQRTQVTLWSMAKSPLIFGGDVRNLDDTTYGLITNPTLLDINFFSSNNNEFPAVTSSNSLKEDQVISTLQSAKHVADGRSSETTILGLTSCSDVRSIGWFTEALDQDLERICWREKLRRNKHQKRFCLYKRKSHVASDEDIVYQQKYQGKFHLLAADRSELCLHASPKRKITSREYRRGSFSPCRWDTNQLWELNPNGTLANSYSSQCATMKSFEADQAIPTGVRSWIATGTNGEIYVAFFNLKSEQTAISANIADLAKALPGKIPDGASCKANEVWSGQDFGIINQSISTPVQTHGVALFVLNCAAT